MPVLHIRYYSIQQCGGFARPQKLSPATSWRAGAVHLILAHRIWWWGGVEFWNSRHGEQTFASLLLTGMCAKQGQQELLLLLTCVLNTHGAL